MIAFICIAAPFIAAISLFLSYRSLNKIFHQMAHLLKRSHAREEALEAELRLTLHRLKTTDPE